MIDHQTREPPRSLLPWPPPKCRDLRRSYDSHRSRSVGRSRSGQDWPQSSHSGRRRGGEPDARPALGSRSKRLRAPERVRDRCGSGNTCADLSQRVLRLAASSSFRTDGVLDPQSRSRGPRLRSTSGHDTTLQKEGRHPSRRLLRPKRRTHCTRLNRTGRPQE